MTTRTRVPSQPVRDPEPSGAAISWVGLLVPFALVLVALLVLGTHSTEQLILTSMLVVFALGILVLRWRAHHHPHAPS